MAAMAIEPILGMLAEGGAEAGAAGAAEGGAGGAARVAGRVMGMGGHGGGGGQSKPKVDIVQAVHSTLNPFQF